MTNPQTVHLIAIGTCPAKPLSEFIPGDIVVYNYGQTATIVSNEQVSPKRFEFTVVNSKGDHYTQHRAGTTLIGFGGRKS